MCNVENCPTHHQHSNDPWMMPGCLENAATISGDIDTKLDRCTGLTYCFAKAFQALMFSSQRLVEMFGLEQHSSSYCCLAICTCVGFGIRGYISGQGARFTNEHNFACAMLFIIC